MTVILLECWSVVEGEDGSHLRGRVYGDGAREDGTYVTTTRVVNANGRRCTTASGSIYEVGDPDPRWLKELHDMGRKLDPMEPVKVKR